MNRRTCSPILLLFTLLLFTSTTVRADSEGFHYVPLRGSYEFLFGDAWVQEVEFQTTIAQLGEAVYGGSNGDSTMYGLGAIGRTTYQQNRFVAMSPQYGLNFFVGTPHDSTGEARARLSLQAPFAFHWVFQLYRDDRGDYVGKNFVMYLGPVVPMTIDVTPDGFSTSGDLGAQVGFVYSEPLGNSMVQWSAGVAKFFTGYFFVNDSGPDKLRQVTGEPVDYGGGVSWFYIPWKFGVAAELHMTSSLGDQQGDTIYLGSLQLRYFPK